MSTAEFTEKDGDSATAEPAAILTRKVTPAHRAVIEARDAAYQVSHGLLTFIRFYFSVQSIMKVKFDN